MGAYSDRTVDHRGLVKLLLEADYHWCLSERDNPIYHPLGEPIARHWVRKGMSPLGHGGGKWVEECLWTSYQPVLDSEAMSDIKGSKLLEALYQQIEDAKSAIRAITLAQRGFDPGTGSTTKVASGKSSAPKRKGPEWSKAKRKAHSVKMKALWAKRKKGKT